MEMKLVRYSSLDLSVRFITREDAEAIAAGTLTFRRPYCKMSIESARRVRPDGYLQPGPNGLLRVKWDTLVVREKELPKAAKDLPEEEVEGEIFGAKYTPEHVRIDGEGIAARMENHIQHRQL
jgi:hypothetical protein